jgi:creatinine amidohydrolase
MEHDWRSVTYVANQVAVALAPQVLVAEGLMAGVSEHHMTHHGTLTLRPGTFLAVVNDLIRSVVHAGFRNVLVLNGHGGNIVPCEAVWDQFLREFQINLEFVSYWDVLTEQDGIELLRGGSRVPDDLPGHAQEFETAVAWALFPENIRRDALSDQADTTPTLASAEQGNEFLKRVINRLTVHVQAMIDGTRQQEIPPFHP